jgi:hypothetical protein
VPKNTYGLRRRGRGRQPKKSHIYKSDENLIFSHEKDEEMNKHDDSEFKLPNEDKSKNLRNLIPIEVPKEEPYVNEFVSDFNKDVDMAEEVNGKPTFVFLIIHKVLTSHYISQSFILFKFVFRKQESSCSEPQSQLQSRLSVR